MEAVKGNNQIIEMGLFSGIFPLGINYKWGLTQEEWATYAILKKYEEVELQGSVYVPTGRVKETASDMAKWSGFSSVTLRRNIKGLMKKGIVSEMPLREDGTGWRILILHHEPIRELQYKSYLYERALGCRRKLITDSVLRYYAEHPEEDRALKQEVNSWLEEDELKYSEGRDHTEDASPAPRLSDVITDVATSDTLACASTINSNNIESNNWGGRPERDQHLEIPSYYSQEQGLGPDESGGGNNTLQWEIPEELLGQGAPMGTTERPPQYNARTPKLRSKRQKEILAQRSENKQALMDQLVVKKLTENPAGASVSECLDYFRILWKQQNPYQPYSLTDTARVQFEEIFYTVVRPSERGEIIRYFITNYKDYATDKYRYPTVYGLSQSWLLERVLSDYFMKTQPKSDADPIKARVISIAKGLGSDKMTAAMVLSAVRKLPESSITDEIIREEFRNYA